MENEEDKEDEEEDEKEEDEDKEEIEGNKEEIEKNKEEAEEEIVKNSKIEKINGENIKKENKQLKKMFFIAGIFVLFFVGVFILINSQNSFEYQGVKFYVDKQARVGETSYRTSLPVDSKHKITGGAVFADYNFYLRNDPRKLRNLPLKLEENITLKKNVVINFTGDFNCDGDEIIAVANLIKVLGVLDVKVVKDETARCDYGGRYTFLQLQLGEETSIEQFGPSCYNLNINNCEVLEVTERYILELLSEVTRNRLQ